MTPLSQTNNNRWTLAIAVVVIFALAGSFIVNFYGNNASVDVPYGILIGALIGIGLVLAVEFASVSLRKKPALLLIPLMLIGVFSLAVPVHANYVLGWQFYPTAGTPSEKCQMITVSNFDTTTSSINQCTGLGAQIYKDTSETDLSHDNYLIDMKGWALNGTNDSCFDYGKNCGRPVVMTQIVASIGISLPSGSYGLSGQNPVGPGSTCTNTQQSASVTFAGVGLSFLLPAMCTTWNSSPNWNWNTQTQSSCWASLGLYCSPDVLATNGQYADYYVEIAVPESASFNVTFGVNNTLTYETTYGQFATANDNLSGSLHVDPPSPLSSFTTSASPTQVTIVCYVTSQQCGSGSSTITVSTQSTGYADMSASGPSGWSLGWSVLGNTLSFSSAGQLSDLLSINVPYNGNTPPGTYYITVWVKGAVQQQLTIAAQYVYQTTGGSGCAGCRLV